MKLVTEVGKIIRPSAKSGAPNQNMPTWPRDVTLHRKGMIVVKCVYINGMMELYCCTAASYGVDIY